MYSKLRVVLLLILVKEFVLALEGNTKSGGDSGGEGSSKILSRRKRYLIFPDGSSFQLVQKNPRNPSLLLLPTFETYDEFSPKHLEPYSYISLGAKLTSTFILVDIFCTQNQGYLQIGDIIWFGNTAALAWELPTDPKLFHFFKQQERDYAQNRDGVSKLIYFLDENGKVLSKVPYVRKPIVNPAFAKRSIDQHIKTNDTIKILHEKQKHLRHFQYLDGSSIEFHREGRKSFYTQLEKFIEAVGWNGRECVLRMLCEVGKGGTEQGMFLEELMRVIFTLPSGSFNSELHKQYDLAHRASGDCDQLYPHCEEFNSINYS